MQLHKPRSIGQAQRARNPRRAFRRDVPGVVTGPHAGDLLFPLVHHRAAAEHHVIGVARPARVVQAKVRRVQVARQRLAILHFIGDMDAQVVPQSLADARAVVDHGDAKLLQVFPRADAGQHQQLG